MPPKFHPTKKWFAPLAAFLSSWMLIFCPIPCGLLRRQMVGMVGQDRRLEFYSHPNFVCVLHLIWVGWVVAAAGIYQEAAVISDWPLIPLSPFSWCWTITLLLTVAVLGLKFDRVACGFLAAALVISVLGVILVETQVRLPILAKAVQLLATVPMQIPWGIPAVTSLVLGLMLAGVVTWQRLNDRWILPAFGNYIEHINFQHQDRSISKGAKNFVAVFDCLVRRYLFFGYGDIEVRSSVGGKLIDKIEGVFFAAAHAEAIKRRLSATDVNLDDATAELEEEETEEHEAVEV